MVSLTVIRITPPVTKPTVVASSAEHESPADDNYAALIYRDSQRRKREAEEAVAAAAKEKENAMTAPESENEGQGTQHGTASESSFIFDLSDVPPQPPIPRSAGHIKEGAPKYKGVYFLKAKKKWFAQIMIGGKQRHIGYYDNEEEAAVDYARAVYKYRSEKKQAKAREQRSVIVDLSDVPPQPPIPKSSGQIKEGASKYVGVAFDKSMKKWRAQIGIDGKLRSHIGYYDNEEEAAIDYARAVFKYRSEKNQAKARDQSSFLADLSDVPPRPPITKRVSHVKEGASKYVGVCFDKRRKKWSAQIMIGGKQRRIGYYDNEEEAAIDYARAVYKYRSEKKAETEKTQHALKTSKRKRPPCADDEEKADSSKRYKEASSRSSSESLSRAELEQKEKENILMLTRVLMK